MSPFGNVSANKAKEAIVNNATVGGAATQYYTCDLSVSWTNSSEKTGRYKAHVYACQTIIPLRPDY